MGTMKDLTCTLVVPCHQVLICALRDFSTPKMPIHDIPIFLRLGNGLFPGLPAESKVDKGPKAKIIRVAKERGLQHDEMFANKTRNFQELPDVPVLLGPAGCAEATIWGRRSRARTTSASRRIRASRSP